MKKRLSVLLVLAMVLSLVVIGNIPTAHAATVYNVGPGQTYTNVEDVPWESLNAGDTVNIYYRATPYYTKIAIDRQGTSSQPITIHGVPDANGNLPIIDGQNAISRLAMSYSSEARGVIQIMATDIPSSCQAQYIVIENLEIRNGHTPYTFTDESGANVAYVASTAGIWIQQGDNITVRNCKIHDCGNGFFSFYGDSYGNASRDITLEGCYIYNNGNSGSGTEHNNYTESMRTTIQYNRFEAPVIASSMGNNIKDRSAGIYVRYNFIRGGNKQLDLVDAEDSPTLQQSPLYNTANYVYGNVIIENSNQGNYQVCNFGGDQSGCPNKTQLYFYNNTVISQRTDKMAVIRCDTNDSSADLRNNIMYAYSGSVYVLEQYGNITMSHNWLNTGWIQRVATKKAGTFTDDGTQVTGSAPGFVSFGSDDFHLAVGSACINAGTSLNAAVLPDYNITQQYVNHQSHTSRTMNGGAWDIGAFEY